MKTVRSLLLTLIPMISLCAPLGLGAQTPPTTTPPVVVVPQGDSSQYQDLKGIPPAVQALLVSFDVTRDKYLVQQAVLLAKLKNATTDAEREAIRVQLQANRDAFLASVQAFREELKDELTALKGKISHEEFLRIVDAAHDAVTEGGLQHHRGH